MNLLFHSWATYFLRSLGLVREDSGKLAPLGMILNLLGSVLVGEVVLEVGGVVLELTGTYRGLLQRVRGEQAERGLRQARRRARYRTILHYFCVHKNHRL